MSRDSPTPEEIIEAVSATGFIMEQRVATQFESLGFLTLTGYPFQDLEDPTKSREVDVRAYLQTRKDEERKIAVAIELFCECKNNENPFVFLQRPKRTDEHERFRPEQYIFPFDKYDDRFGNSIRAAPAFQKFQFQKSHYYARDDFKAVQFCKIVRQGNRWEANQGAVYDALFYPLAKAVIATKRLIEALRSPRSPADWKFIRLIFPIVVLQGKIYQLKVTDGPLKLEEVEHVSFIRELTSKHVKGQFLLDFTTERGLAGFVKAKVIPFVEELTEEAIRLGDKLGQKPISG